MEDEGGECKNVQNKELLDTLKSIWQNYLEANEDVEQKVCSHKKYCCAEKEIIIYTFSITGCSYFYTIFNLSIIRYWIKKNTRGSCLLCSIVQVLKLFL